MATPADLAPLADELLVSNRDSGFMPSEAFTLGPYQVTRVHRAGTTSGNGGFSVGGYSNRSSNSKTFYDFDMKAPGGLYQGHCGVRLEEKGRSYHGLVFQGSASGSLDCNCSGSSPGVAELVLEWEPRSQGILIARDGGTTPLAGVFVSQKGGRSSFIGGQPLGYEARGDVPIGAVDRAVPERVWINRALEPSARADVACLFVGLLLFRPSDGQSP